MYLLVLSIGLAFESKPSEEKVLYGSNVDVNN